MKNKELFRTKLDRIDGKVRTIKVMVTRQGTSVEDINEVLDAITNELSDLNTMLERIQTVYGGFRFRGYSNHNYRCWWACSKRC